MTVTRDAPPVGEVRGQVIGVGRHQRDEQGARERIGRRVVLLQEGAEHLGIGHVASALDDEVLSADQLAVPHLHDLEAGLVLLPGHADRVVLGAAEGGHLLLLHRALDGAQLVARDGRLLVVQRVAVRPHLLAQLGGDRLLPAVQEVDDLADRLPIRRLLDRLDARPLASVDEVEQAGPFEDALAVGDVEVAGPEREDLAEELQRLVDARGRGIRAEVAAAVADEPPRAHDPRKVLAERDLHERVALVVPETDVEARPMLLDEVALEEVGLADGVGDDVVDVRDVADHPADADVLGRPLPEVGAHAAPERVRLADVQDAPARVLHQVDARAGRQAPQHGAQRLGECALRAHGSILGVVRAGDRLAAGPHRSRRSEIAELPVHEPEQPIQAARRRRDLVAVEPSDLGDLAELRLELAAGHVGRRR